MIKKTHKPTQTSPDPERWTRLIDLISRLGIKFKNKSYLEIAFIHSSFKNENSGIKEHNERLEFLGDSVLGLVVAKYLFRTDPSASEGELSRQKAKLVSTTVLNGLSDKLGLIEFVLLGKGEGRGDSQKKLGANLFESLVGAIYLDQGMEVAEEFIIKHLIGYIQHSDTIREATDFKSILQETCQKKFKLLPTYRLIQETGPDHEKTFYVNVSIRDKYSAEGQGRNKKFAEQDAARQMLKILKIKF
ncbi:ribonuclease III [Leptospira langatensis]|uniref:Ribonuclease 3 n=1 Tax=Leptospira langatensis TaxID=2484983 RepID=A0A5F1ZWA6_9LEPT|nr:ribonuclease III [Leptospira langatensis]TGK00063.1 ribonuclease III [Leptospira langatensis]TGL42697.1 ribonuclease III [Leptospira langatensis]